MKFFCGSYLALSLACQKEVIAEKRVKLVEFKYSNCPVWLSGRHFVGYTSFFIIKKAKPGFDSEGMLEHLANL
ncbi:hypothetical protein Tsubulata_013072 [Turnera subulata]|uniref:Uncharacterized protein n=1 Tax=Turnera subulata TaxID=218843 RepID=A0A9Q0F3F1_9ROSI|nr:hypothetical protein Tsubulata_013072 [Turnera subulata]